MANTQPQTNTATDSRPYLQKLREGEQHWAWKFGFRAAICVLDVVGIGCAAWLAQHYANPSNSLLDYFYYDYFMIPGALATVRVNPWSTR